MAHPEKPAPSRVLSIDILRGFALICMVLIHFVIYFGDSGAMNTWLYFGFNHLLGDWGASCFLIIMGISQVYSGQTNTGLDQRLLFKRSGVRGLFIFCTGLVMLVLARGPAHLWQWDILTLIGFATIILFFCRWVPSWLILIFVLLIGVMTPFLRGQLAIAPLWNANFIPVPVISSYFPNILFDPARELEMIWTVKNILQGFLLTGEFPVFPWILFPLVGFALGRRMLEQKIQHDMHLIFIACAALVLLGLGLAYAGSMRPGVSVISDYITPLCFYPDSFSIIFIQLGLSMTLITLLYYLFDIRGNLSYKPGVLASLFIQASQSSLTFYFLHYLLIGWPLAIVYLLSGKYLIYNLMGLWPALLCGIAAVGLLSVVLRQNRKYGGKYTLEWLLGTITRDIIS